MISSIEKKNTVRFHQEFLYVTHELPGKWKIINSSCNSNYAYQPQSKRVKSILITKIGKRRK